MEKEKIMQTKKRLKVFLNNELPIHLITKQDSWMNGYVLDMDDDFFRVFDRVDGVLLVLYSDVRKLDQFTGNTNTLPSLNALNERRKTNGTRI